MIVRRLSWSFLGCMIIRLVAACDDGGASGGVRDAGEQPALDASVLHDAAALRDAELAAGDAFVEAGHSDPLDASRVLGDASWPAPSDAELLGDSSGEDGAVSASDAGSDAARDAGNGGPTCTPIPESCDQNDNDCDGLVDEDCLHAPFTLLDFDVAGDGAAVLAGKQAGRVWMTCFGPDGSVARAAFEVAGPESNHTMADGQTPAALSQVDVARSRVTGTVVVTYAYSNWPASPRDWRVYAAFYNRDCVQVGAPRALDVDFPRTAGSDAVVREASAFVADDGRSYLIYEHQTAGAYQVLIHDALGGRLGHVDIPHATCAGGARTRVLALDRASGKFAVLCENPSNNARVFRRFAADGTALGSGFAAIADAQPQQGLPFHFFGGALNASGTLVFFGRARDGVWIVRTYDAADVLSAPAGMVASNGKQMPSARVTAAGDFLIELPGPDYGLALVSGSGAILRTWQSPNANFELDGADRVYVQRGSNLVSTEPSIDLR